MSGYLEAYAAGEEKREKLEKLFHRSLIVLALLLVAGGTLFFIFRNYRETRQAERFFDLLRAQDYKAAYALWGCTESTPCSEYSMQKFLEDWGPKSAHANLSSLEIAHTRGCTSGVIIEASFGGGDTVYLWVDRATRNLGFAPWPVCNPVYRPNAANKTTVR